MSADPTGPVRAARSSRRLLFDRALRRVQSTPVASFTPPPRQIDTDLWVVDRRLALPPGLVMPARMTIVRLPGGGLLLHSPVALDAGLAAAVRSIAGVEAILVPNPFHHLFVAEWTAACPGTRVYAAPGVADRLPGFGDAAIVADRGPAGWEEAIEHVVFGPTHGLAEVVLFHRPSRTLILTDLAFNLPTIDGAYNRLMWRIAGVPRRFGPSRTVRFTLLRDRTAARAPLAKIAAWDFARIIVAHGDVIEQDARAEFARAFAAYL